MTPYGDEYTTHFDHVPPAEVFPVPSNALLILRGDGWTDDLLAALGQVLAPGVVAVRLNDADTIETLDPDAMRAAGWVRAAPGVATHADRADSLHPPELLEGD